MNFVMLASKAPMEIKKSCCTEKACTAEGNRNVIKKSVVNFFINLILSLTFEAYHSIKNFNLKGLKNG